MKLGLRGEEEEEVSLWLLLLLGVVLMPGGFRLGMRRLSLSMLLLALKAALLVVFAAAAAEEDLLESLTACFREAAVLPGWDFLSMVASIPRVSEYCSLKK